jgi:hypothetical protein
MFRSGTSLTGGEGGGRGGLPRSLFYLLIVPETPEIFRAV